MNQRDINEAIGLDISQRQKDQAHLFAQYNRAMRLLKQKYLDEGQKMLERILMSNSINETQLRKLKKSVILSMGNVLLIKNQKEMALSYFNQALNLQERIVREEQEAQCFDPNTTISQQYMLLMKMYELSEDLGYVREGLYFLKKALIVCPSIWRERVIGLLQRGYVKLRMGKELQDLKRLKSNSMMMRKIIGEQQKRIWNKCKHHVNSNCQTQQRINIKDEITQQLLNRKDVKRLRVLRINVSHKQNTSYSQFQYLLTVCYVLLKCQSKRNFNRKRYLHKKYDSNNTAWMAFLNQYDLSTTQLELAYPQNQQSGGDNINNDESLSVLNQQQQSASKQFLKQDRQCSNQQLIEQLVTELLRIKYTKKKKPLNKNLIIEKQKQKQSQQKENLITKISKQPQDQPTLLPTKSSKKHPSQQPSKQTYDSITSYCKQISDKNGFDRQQLRWLHQLDEQMYSNLWKVIVENDDDESKQDDEVINIKTKSWQNKQEQLFKKQNNSYSPSLEQQKKLNAKDKKQLQLKKIVYHNSLFNKFVQTQTLAKNIINHQRNQDGLRFINCYNLFSRLIDFVFTKQQEGLIGETQAQKQTKRNQILAQMKKSREQMDAKKMKGQIQIEKSRIERISDEKERPELLDQEINLNSNQNIYKELWIFSKQNQVFRREYSLYKSQSIRRLLGKCILKITMVNTNWLTSTLTNRKDKGTNSKGNNEQNNEEVRLEKYQQYMISSILIQHYEYMSMKKPKTTQFTPHQMNKQSILKNYIESHYLLTKDLVKNQNHNHHIQLKDGKYSNGIEQHIYIRLLRTQKLIQFYTSPGNFNKQLLDFNHQLWTAQFKNLKNILNKQLQVITLSPFKQSIVDYVNEMSQQKIESMITQRQQIIITLMANNIDTVNNKINISNKACGSIAGNINSMPQPSQIDSLLLALQYPSTQPTEHQASADVLHRMVTHLSTYFSKIQEQSQVKQQFSLKSMDLLTKQMKVQELVLKLYIKLRSASGSAVGKEFDLLKGNQKQLLIGLMIKLCLIGTFNNNDDCLRILFYLTNCYFKQYTKIQQPSPNKPQSKQTFNQSLTNNHPQSQPSTTLGLSHTILTYKLIILYKSLIDYSEKRQKLQSSSLVLRKLYDSVIGKNLHVIYQGSRQSWGRLLMKWKQRQEIKMNSPKVGDEKDNQEEGQNNKQIKSRQHGEQEGMMIDEKNQPIIDKQNIINSQLRTPHTNQLTAQESTLSQYLIMHSRLNPIFHQIYHFPQSQFSPKRIQDAVGYFIYLSRYFYDEFSTEDEVQLSSHVMKMFRKCYTVFSEKKAEAIKMCHSYKQMLIKVQRYFEGLDKQNQQLIAILKGNMPICQCCTPNTIIPPFNYSQIVYILARLFQSNPIEEERSQCANINVGISQLDEQYYKQYLMLNLHRPQSWMTYIKMQAKKAFLYFDSLVGADPLEGYKNKFLFAKKIINFVKLHLKDIHPYQQSKFQISQSQNIVNQQQNTHNKTIALIQSQDFIVAFQKLLKYCMLTLNTLNVLKLKQREFLMTLKSQQTLVPHKESKQYKDMAKKYLQGLKTIRQKFDWQQHSIASLFLGLVQVQIPQITQFIRGGLNMEVLTRVNLVEEKSRQMIAKLGQYESKQNNVLHLQEDLVVEYYMLLGRVLESILQMILRCNSYKMHHNVMSAEQKKFVELQQLDKYLTDCMQRVNQLTSNPKYQLILSGLEGRDKAEQISQQDNKGILNTRMVQMDTIREEYAQEVDNVVNNEEIEVEQNQQETEKHEDQNQRQEQQQYQCQQQQRNEEDLVQKRDETIDKKRLLSTSAIRGTTNKKFNFMPLQIPNTNYPTHYSQIKNDSKIILNVTSTNINANKKTTKKTIQPSLCLTQYFKAQLKQSTLSQGTQISSIQVNNLQTMIINKINTLLNAICMLFKSLPKYQLKRYKYRRSVTQALLYVSKLYLKYSVNKVDKQYVLEVIRDYFNIRSDDIVFIFTHSDRNKSTQKNLQLAQFYNRTLVHNLQRFWFIRHLIDSFRQLKMIQNLIVLLRKLNKLMVVDQGKEVQYLVTLYFYGVDKYLDLVQQIANNSQLQQRYEKILIQFRNKIKRSIQIKLQSKKNQKLNQTSTTPIQQQIKDAREKAIKQNYYHQRLDKFIKEYEAKYERKVKLKKSKKERQLQKQLKEKQLQKERQLSKIQEQKEKEKQQQIAQEQRLKQSQIQKVIQFENEQKQPYKEQMQIQKKSQQKEDLEQNPLQIEPIVEVPSINKNESIKQFPEEYQVYWNEFIEPSSNRANNPLGLQQKSRNILKKEQVRAKRERKQGQTKKKRQIINLVESSSSSQKQLPHQQLCHQQLSPKRQQSDFYKKVKQQVNQLSKNQKPVQCIVIDVEVDEDKNNQHLDIIDHLKKLHKTQ